MKKTITNVGNSKGIIIPANLIAKYGFLFEVEIEAMEDGILIKPVKNDFQQKLEDLKKNKEAIYAVMRQQANSKEAIDYYNNPDCTSDDLDIFVLD